MYRRESGLRLNVPEHATGRDCIPRITVPQMTALTDFPANGLFRLVEGGPEITRTVIFGTTPDQSGTFSRPGVSRG